MIVLTEIEITLFVFREVVDIQSLSHSRPGAVWYGWIEGRKTYLGVVDTGNGLCRGIAVSAVNVVFYIYGVIVFLVALIFFFHFSYPFLYDLQG